MSNSHTLADVNSHALADANRARRRLQPLLAQHGVPDWFQLPASVLESFADQVAPKDISYYDLKKNWTRKIVPHLGDQELNDILTRDFNSFTWGRWRLKFGPNELPHDHETFFGYFPERGRLPRFRMYVKHSAVHWLVNFNLRLAMLALPSHEWRILTSDSYSTVWNGYNLLFDLDWYGSDVSAKQCFAIANEEELAPGEYMEIGPPLHWSWEDERRRQERNGRRGDAQEMAEVPPKEEASANNSGSSPPM
jgi:hypothetical protein